MNAKFTRILLLFSPTLYDLIVFDTILGRSCNHRPSLGSWALLMMPVSLVAPEIDKRTFDGPHNGRLTVPNLLLITSGRPAEID